MTRTAATRIAATAAVSGAACLAFAAPAQAAMPPDPERGERVVVRAPAEPGTDAWSFEIAVGAFLAGTALAAAGAVRRRRSSTLPWEGHTSPAAQREEHVEDGREVLSWTAGRAP